MSILNVVSVGLCPMSPVHTAENVTLLEEDLLVMSSPNILLMCENFLP